MADMNGGSAAGDSPASDAAPGRESSSKDREELDSPATGSSTLKKIVEVACWPCRKRKSKCTGERPSCACCLRKSSACTYEHEEGLTRLGSLRYKLSEATVRTETLQYFFDQLRTRNDNEAACLLALLRMDVDVDVLVEQLRTNPDELWKPTADHSSLIPRLKEQIELASRRQSL